MRRNIPKYIAGRIDFQKHPNREPPLFKTKPEAVLSNLQQLFDRPKSSKSSEFFEKYIFLLLLRSELLWIGPIFNVFEAHFRDSESLEKYTLFHPNRII